MRRALSCVWLVVALGACETESVVGADAGALDVGGSDVPSGVDAATDRPTVDATAVDAGGRDAGATDAGATDAGATDAGATDAGTVDAGVIDVGSSDVATDAGVIDAGSTDTGPADVGAIDAGPADVGPTDTGAVDAGPADAGPTDAGPACNVLTLGAPAAPSIAASGSAPAFTGGTIPEGTWHLSRRTFFGGPADSVTRRETMAFGGAAFDFNNVVELGGAAPIRSRGSYATSGSMFTATSMCPAAGSSAFPYRVMPDGTLLLQSGTEVRTFARQCGAAVLSGPVVSQTAGAGAAPAPAGGTIANGTYQLTAVVKHGGGALSTGTRQQTSVITDGNFQSVVYDSQSGFSMYQGTLVTSGATLTTNLTCPVVGTAPATNYSATATTFTQYANANEYLVFTRM